MVAKTRSKKSTFSLEKFNDECSQTDGSLFALNAVYKKNTSKRIQFINELSMTKTNFVEIIRIFPHYRKHCELILHDYEKRVELLNGIRVKSISERFRRYAPLILEQANKSLNLKWPKSAEQKQLLALKLLPELLALNSPSKKKPISLVMEKPRSLTTRRFLGKIRQASKRRIPLIVVMKKKPSLDLRLLIENQLLKINGDVADALELFFAAHWTFKLKFDRSIKELVAFLGRISGINKYSSYKNLYDIVEKALQ